MNTYTVLHSNKIKDSGQADDVHKIGGTDCSMHQSSSQSMSRRLSSATRSCSARLMDDARHDDNTEKPTLPAPSFRRLLMLNAPEWKQALMGSFCAALFGSIQPVHAYVMGSMFSVYFLICHAEIKEQTRMYALVFVALAGISFVLNIGQHYSFGAMGEYVTKRIRELMLIKILTFEIGWFDHGQELLRCYMLTACQGC